MSEKTRTELKAYFETGDMPTQSEFEDFIDSVPNLAQGEGQKIYFKEILYTDFVDIEALSSNFPFFTAPENYFVQSLIVTINQVFESPSNSTLDIYLYNTNGSAQESNGINIGFGATSGYSYSLLDNAYPPISVMSAMRTLVMSLVSNTDNLEDFTAGRVCICAVCVYVGTPIT
jgi:hypothetical protein